MTFQKRKENFICEHCGADVLGDGYTNHCPKCLWSKHVDIDPGDREAACGGMMEPWDIEPHAGGFRVVHCCAVCGFERPSPFLMSDDMQVFADIARKAAERKAKKLR